MNSPFKKVLLNLLALAIGLALTGVMLVAAEVFLRLRHAGREADKDRDQVEDNMSSFIEEIPVYGTRAVPDFHGRHHCRINGVEIYNPEYVMDEEGYRIIPVDSPEEREEAALFFGCSFTFGLGVEAEESLPVRFGQECEKFLPVNFAVPGYGLQHMWLQIQEEGFKDRVPRDKGIVLYGFIDHHLDRLMGQKDLVAEWGWVLPWLDISETEVRLEGLMSDREARGSSLIKLMQSLHLGRFILHRLPLLHEKSYTEEDELRTLTWLLLDIKKRLKEILPGYELIVFSYPWTPKSEALTPYLEAAGIPFFDYDPIYVALGNHPEPYLFADVAGQQPWGHPNAALHADLASRLAHDLNCGDSHNNESKKETE